MFVQCIMVRRRAAAPRSTRGRQARAAVASGPRASPVSLHQRHEARATRYVQTAHRAPLWTTTQPLYLAIKYCSLSSVPGQLREETSTTFTTSEEAPSRVAAVLHFCTSFR